MRSGLLCAAGWDEHCSRTMLATQTQALPAAEQVLHKTPAHRSVCRCSLYCRVWPLPAALPSYLTSPPAGTALLSI